MRNVIPAVSAIAAVALFTTACGSSTSVAAKNSSPTLTHKYRPDGDTTAQIDMTKIKSDELKKVYCAGSAER